MSKCLHPVHFKWEKHKTDRDAIKGVWLLVTDDFWEYGQVTVGSVDKWLLGVWTGDCKYGKLVAKTSSIMIWVRRGVRGEVRGGVAKLPNTQIHMYQIHVFVHS